MTRALLLALGLIGATVLTGGCSGGDPEPKVGDNPAAANGRPAAEALTPAQKARRANSKPQGSPW